MKIPVNWLKEFIDIDLSLEKLAEKLLRLGIEVERIEKSATLQGIRVGKVLSVKKHPSADKLTVCMVDVGDGSPKQIICGASNVKEAVKVPVILPGNVLPNGLKIEKRSLRGIESEGMICSKEELELEDDSDGIWILPEKCKVGEELSDEIQVDDAVIDIKITPNRGDCLSIMGIARELAAVDYKKFKIPKVEIKETNGRIKDKIDIKVENLDLCPRYTARMLEGVQIKSSPYWMRRRLILAGVRPINNIVDITNYVMLETGQPLHAFDYDKIEDKKIIVRRAKLNEKILCLDGIKRALSAAALVIADNKKPVALAGIMGGEETGVDKNTKSIIVESANFSPTLIRKTSRALNISSESSYRFERGVDIEGTLLAADRACYLMQEWAGGKAVSGTADIKAKIAKKNILLNPAEIKRILGIEIGSYEKILKSLGFEIEKGKGCLKVRVPSWRNDIRQEIDLIEEIARVNNYDLIPLTLPFGKIPALKEDNRTRIINKCRSILTRLSLTETVNYSFVSTDLLRKSLVAVTAETIKIENAISEEFEVLRASLLPSLLQVAQENISKGDKNLKIFELRSIYKYRKNNLPEENIHLGILLGGDWQQPSWIDKGVKSSFYVLKGIIETLFDELGVKLGYKEEKHPFLNDGFSFSLLKGDVKIGMLGEVNSSVMDNFSLKEKTFLAEIDIESILPSVQSKKKIQPLQKYPPVVRDVSFLVPNYISSQQVEKMMSEEAKHILESVKLFDYYKGKQVPEGFRSISYSLFFRSPNKTLTDGEVNELQDKIVRKLEKELGLKLRS
ncbi:MAG: phenylalanine--tRNA ligase subunit beta [Candidatus Ratteibacteria bacterium]|nr:phenylalanine--tRNA ligase subunit beta [Candidatus Ratteibacteria bacterium]